MNGIKNGQGKEYNWNGNIKFLGEFLNGAKYKGKLLEYYDNNKLKSEFDYFKGEIKGKGKKYYNNGNLEFYF